MRTWLLALVAAALPFALYFPLLDAGGPGAGLPQDPDRRLLALLLVAGAGLALFAAGARFSAAAGLAAAIAWASFPSIPDLVASGATVILGIQGATAVLALVAVSVMRRPGPGAPPILGGVSVAVIAIVVSLRPEPLPIDPDGKPPSGMVPLLFAIAVLFVARVVAARADLAPNARRGLVAGLAAVLVAAALAGQARARSWADPGAFWERAVAERPDAPSALGVSARLRVEAGDLPGAGVRLRGFVDAVERGEGRGERNSRRRTAGAEGAVRAAAALMRAGAADRESVEAALDAAEALSPRKGAVLRATGEARLDLGEFLEARACFEEAAKADPADADAWNGLARTGLATGRVDEALDAATRATGLRSTEPAFIAVLSEALLAAGKDREALDALSSARAARPGSPILVRASADAYLRIAEKSVSRRRYGRALLLLDRGLEIDASHPGCQALRRTLIAEYDAQRPDALRWIEAGPDGNVTLQSWLQFAGWLCRWGRYQEAEQHFSEMFRRYDAVAQVHFHYGQEFWEDRGTEEGYGRAIGCYRDALARDASHVESRNRLWQCLLALGRRADAAEEAARFVAAAPAHPDSFDAERFLESMKPR
ncbi:MAG TPA: tetratricopeptide repeat protein [Planctomycetota bacterium]|nr:tetratricopeptide repeat protein [Planctomycetota bacterium]